MGTLSDLENNEYSNYEDILGAGLGEDSMHPMPSFVQESVFAIETHWVVNPVEWELVPKKIL